MIGKIKIGPIHYKVSIVPKVGLQNDGDDAEIDYRIQEIHLKYGLSPSYQSVCIMHEVIHGILSQQNDNKINNNEEFIDRFAHSLLQFIVDNEHLLSDLIQTYKEEAKNE